LGVFIIAELSANHNGNLQIAKDTIKAIAETGANAVKVQTYKPQSLTLNLNTGFFSPRTEGLWAGKTPWELYTMGSLPYDWHKELQELSESLGLVFFSTPFDKEAVDFLENLNIPLYKIASFEITDIPLIEYVASKNKPVLISTGLANEDDISAAINACFKMGNRDVTLLKCTSNYPALIQDANLLTIPNMIEKFDVKVGLSDHTMGSILPIMSVAMGAEVIEKHVVLNRANGGVDSAFSMEPIEFKEMVNQIRLAEQALGVVNYEISEKDSLRRRSLFVVNDIAEGETFTIENIKSIRPGHGLHPVKLTEVLGRKAKVSLKKGEPLKLENIV
jgi:pseudaminic acid synthase